MRTTNRHIFIWELALLFLFMFYSAKNAYCSHNNIIKTPLTKFKNEENMIIFIDPNLEIAIREELDIPTGYITSAHMTGLTRLVVSNHDIQDLTGLEYANNLQELDLKENRINNILSLVNLNSLKTLNLSGNQISDISPLKNLTNLQVLDLTNNQISDILDLAGLTNLQELYLGNNLRPPQIL